MVTTGPDQAPSRNRGRCAQRPVRWIIVALVAGTVAAFVPHLRWRSADRSSEPATLGPILGMPGAPPTSADGLRQRISEMEKRLAERPEDVAAAVLLADGLLRLARVTGEARLHARAARLLTSVQKHSPAHYDALRLLAATHLAGHKFRDALETAKRARSLRPADAWNYGVIGDASLELGEYEDAFDAFDTMVGLRPGASAYSRVAYARELRGNLPGALRAMQMATEATSAHDPEAQAWYGAQVGELYLKTGRLEEAEREYRRAAFIFPNYPFAMIGRGKVAAARGDRAEALNIYLDQLGRTPTLELAGRIGDLYAQDGDVVEAERYYQLGEDLAGPSRVQTEANLALFLAERDRRLPEAVKVAEAVAATRRDIFTDDALAWAYYKVGRFDEALAASDRSLRTGTRDERILWHAAQIRAVAARRGSP